ASTTNRHKSASLAAATAVRFMERLMARRSPEWSPGVSTKISCSVAVVLMPSTRRRVVWGLGVTILILRPTRALTSVDLPTFGLPATAMKPARKPLSTMGDLLQRVACCFLFRGAAAARLTLGAHFQQTGLGILEFFGGKRRRQPALEDAQGDVACRLETGI